MTDRTFSRLLHRIKGRRRIEEFARQCGLPKSVVHRHLQGQTVPTLDQLEQYATAGVIRLQITARRNIASRRQEDATSDVSRLAAAG